MNRDKNEEGEAASASDSTNANTSQEKKAPKGIARVHLASVAMLTDATWEFVHAILWNNFPFRPSEVEFAKVFIREYYENIPPEIFSRAARKYFEEYCQRAMLARDYIDVGICPEHYLSHPCIFLDQYNLDGFAATKEWYEVERQRKRHGGFLPRRCGASRLNDLLKNLIAN